MAERKKMTIEEAGRKGGETRAHMYSKDELSEQAKKAAQTVEKKYPGFHSEIGSKGGQARGSQKEADIDENE